MAGKVEQTTTAAVSTGGSLISHNKLKQLYATMLQCRLLTERAFGLRTQPRASDLYAASMGQEAIATGFAIDMRPEDTIALAPQNSIASLARGVPLGDIVAQIYKRRSVLDRAPNIIMPTSTPDEQLSLATNVARANKRKKKSNVVVVFSAKATTTLDCWHEALALAAKRNLPIIFVVENNPWAGAAGVQASDDEIDSFEKARSYGFPIITVDANDVVAVYRVAYESVGRVRQGGGPVLVESKPYRLYSPSKRSAANSASRPTERDPLIHMERYLRSKGLFTPRWKDQVAQEFLLEMDAAVKRARKKQRSPHE
jgi:TPP-dependent pyruvate/acetoin dehydrogenase alpha subunit